MSIVCIYLNKDTDYQNVKNNFVYVSHCLVFLLFHFAGYPGA